MKKNIILIDLELSLISSISKSKKLNIEYLITDADESKISEMKNSSNIKNIITRSKFHEQTNINNENLDYKIIDNFKSFQLDSEHYQDRFSDDASIKQYYYYNALFFWIKVFSGNFISAVISDRVAHGANYDSLALNVAKAYGVSAYVFENHMVRRKDDSILAIRSVLDYNEKKRVSLNLNQLKINPVNIDDYLFYPEQMQSAIIKKRKNVKEILKSLLPAYASAIFHMFGYIIKNKSIQHHGLNSPPSKVLKNIIYAKNTLKYYNSNSVDLDKTKKYIFYALHFEPEASIMARARFSNQISIIKQLSQSLPKNWTLYVKEHPDQFKLYGDGWWYYLISIHKFRTKDFYKEILKFSNVRFLKNNVKSQDIINSAEAVSTINGSIASEAIMSKKPLILFGHQSTPFGMCKNVFKFTSTKELKKIIDIIKEGHVPDYSDLHSIVNDYLFELSNTSPNDVQLLIDYLVFDYRADKVDN